MMFISAGHHRKDPGAVANGLKEADLTIKVRDEVVKIIRAIKGQGSVITDVDTETLAEYLQRIKPGNGSVVVEFHFDAANPNVSGTSAFYADNASEDSKAFARAMVDVGATIMDIPNRGAHSESESHRGRLGLVHKAGINCLVEVAFITNSQDIHRFNQNFSTLCNAYASIIMAKEDIIK